MASPPWLSVARLWDDCAHTARRHRQGVLLRLARRPIRIHVSRLGPNGWLDLMSREYRPDGSVGQRNALALGLFDQCRPRLRRPLLLVGTSYCRAGELLSNVRARNATVAASIPPKVVREVMETQDWSFLSSSKWHDFGSSAGAFLTPITIGQLSGRLFAFDSEPIGLPRRGTKFLAYFGPNASWSALARVVAHSPRPVTRPASPEHSTRVRPRALKPVPSQRPNMAIAVLQDNRLSSNDVDRPSAPRKAKRHIRFADIFAGAGGLSLGFLTARNAQYELCSAVDISPICMTTLKRNFEDPERRHGITGRVSHDAFKLADIARCQNVKQLMASSMSGGRIDVLVGGPPCQPFSSARRRPASRAEARLVDSFSRAVELIEPTVFLLENVQGILWREASSGVSPADKVMRRMEKAGYRVAARVLDAVWFGAPQHRARAFIVGLHPRLGSNTAPEDVFPSPHRTGTPSRPYRTVLDSIGELPEIPNGHSRLEIPAYTNCASGDGVDGCRVFDHVTSRHADYVLARFRRLRPGDNWTAIQEMMTNYSRKETTHSNIYRRLEWDKPSVTLGHYRKSMLVHPEQDRGLSLREALRLQTFPDWYRLWGHEQTLAIGLDRKQQQLANAVPPVLARAFAERLAELVR